MAVQLNRRRFTVSEFHRLIKAGVLTEDDRVELVEGEILEMSAIGNVHMACVNVLNERLVRSLGDAALVSIQNALRLNQRTELYPDVAVLRRRPDGYWSAIPTAADVLLLVEVSDTTLRYDSRVKLPLYARAEIPEVWVVDLARRRILVHTDPTADGYRSTRPSAPGETITPVAFAELSFAVGDFLPRS